MRAKVADLTSAVTNGYNAMAKQLLQSESYMRHLEQRINVFLKLQNSYNIHLKMKEGIQNMHDAYKKSPGNQHKNLSNIKTGWKDCNQVIWNKEFCSQITYFNNNLFKSILKKLCAIEAQTEALLGTFQFEIESKLF